MYLLILLLFLASAVAGSFESLHTIPHGWTYIKAAEDATPIKLRISLKQQNVDAFHQQLREISTPEHQNYGKYFQGHELRTLLQPTEETTNTTTAWLQEYGITSIDDDGDYILFGTDVGTANRLLDTSFGWYSHIETGQHLVRTLNYSVPELVAKHINFVQPTTRFGASTPMVQISKILSEDEAADDFLDMKDGAADGRVDPRCNDRIIPKCLKNLYNFNGYVPDNRSGNKVGFASFLEQYAKHADQDYFSRLFMTHADTFDANFSVILFNGGLDDQDPYSDQSSTEANLDLQYIFGMSWPIPITEFSTGGRGPLIPDGDQPYEEEYEYNTNEPYLEFLVELLKLENDQIPNSISISYGENEQEIPRSYAEQVCLMFGQLGARGKSVIVSSGDSGVGSFCLSNDGQDTVRFQPQFPATCPYVTSVGGTRYIDPEAAVSFSSGGFSNYWPIPWWQQDAVDLYQRKIGDKNAGYYNAFGRGFPDVAAQAYGYVIVDKGHTQLVMGTSASAPVFNAIIALLNSQLIESGRPTLGLLNPWLYSPKGRRSLNDITTGFSTGCTGYHKPPYDHYENGGPVIPDATWDAIEGWDPVTGLGTPDFSKLASNLPFLRWKGDRD